MPHLQRLYDKYRSQGLAMVALNIAPGEDAQVPAWREAHKYTFPIVLAGAEDFANVTYGVSAAPVNLLLNGEGKAICRYAGAGPGSELMLEAEIRELLGLNPLAPGLHPSSELGNHKASPAVRSTFLRSTGSRNYTSTR